MIASSLVSHSYIISKSRCKRRMDAGGTVDALAADDAVGRANPGSPPVPPARTDRDFYRLREIHR